MTLARRAFIVGTAVVSAVAIPVLCADTPGNPYEPIVVRNAFGIRPPPPPAPEQPITPPAPLAKVVLKGIATMFGPNPQAFFEITEQEPGKTPNIQKPILRQGERAGPVEVLSIDVANNQVRIRNGTVETNVTFEVANANTSPAPANMPAGQGLPHPSLTPPPVNSAYIPPGLGAAPGGPMIIGGNDAGRPGSSVTTYGAGTGDRPLPVRTTPGIQPTTTLPATGNTATDLLRQSARARGIPIPPLPPSSYIPPTK